MHTFTDFDPGVSLDTRIVSEVPHSLSSHKEIDGDCTCCSPPTVSHQYRATRMPTFSSKLVVILVVACFFCLSILVSNALSADNIKILEASPDSLTLQYETPDLETKTRDVDGRVFHVISFQNCAFTHEVGKARIPISVFSIGIPETSEPDVAVLQTETKMLTGYTVYPVEKAVVRTEDVPIPGSRSAQHIPSIATNMTAQTEFAIDQRFYASNSFYPPVVSSVEPSGYLRQQRVATLTICPVQFNPSTKQLKVYQKIVVRVSFHGASRTDTGSSLRAANESAVFEEFYQDVLLNYEQAKDWRKQRSRSPLARRAPSIATGVRYKISVEKDGIYRLDYNYLKAAGIDPGDIDPRKIEIESGGQRVPIYVEGYEDGRFDPGDFVEFYGVKMNSQFTDTNIYWLSWNGSGTLGMMAIKDGSPKTPDAKSPMAFLDTQHWELEKGKNVIYDPLKMVSSENADHFFWSAMRGHDPGNDTISDMAINLPFRMYDLNKQIRLRICFQGITYSRGANKHIVEIVLNGVSVGTATWEGQTEYISDTVLSQRDLKRYNWLTLHCLDANGTSNATDPKWDVYLNWIEMDYWHEFKADNNKLKFSTKTYPPVTRIVQYSITGFTRPDVEIFQIDGTRAIARIINPRITKVIDPDAQKNSISYTTTFEDKVVQPTQYFVVDAATVMRPARIVKDQVSTLHDPANNADYIIITHKDFMKSAERLADFRRRQGLNVIVADIRDVYDEFSYGVFDPRAIQRFLRYAYFNWDRIPSYVLLVGDAHWDYRYVYDVYYSQYENYPRIYVPTYHSQSPEYGQTAMDHKFVTISGDDILPDMFIGRLPVDTDQEADAVVDKIIRYENNPYRGVWQSRILLVADDEKSKSGDDVFEDSRRELAKGYIPVGYEVIPAYLRVIGEPYIVKKLISMETNKGVVIAEYAGHGGAYSWAHEYIFSVDDARELQNYSRYPFVITTTCENGYFDNPAGGFKCIMEEFLLRPNAGAIACLSATRLTYGQGNATFDKILYPKMFSEKPPILGKIVAEAKTEFINLGIATWIPSAEQYTLFGDPATKLALPTLDIEAQITHSSLDSSMQIQLKAGSVKRLKENPITGKQESVTDSGFNAQMEISVIYPNNLDDDKSNDLPDQKATVKVWKGEFGAIQLDIPDGVMPGEGRLRCYAKGTTASAVGGVRFSILKPVIEFYTGRIFNDQDFRVYAGIVDNKGPSGLKSIECVWHNTETWRWHKTRMILGKGPPDAPTIQGSWYVLEEPIPLSRPGTSIEFRVTVTDSEGNIVNSGAKRVRVPIGVNLAISKPKDYSRALITYSYSQSLGAWTLSVPVENNGGKEVKEPIAVYFFEGNPDRNRDKRVDVDSQILGKAVIEYDQWKPGEKAIQTAEAVIKLDEPLFSGIHQIFAWINPRIINTPGEPPEYERVEDADESDDRASARFPINKFVVGKQGEEQKAQSLDATLSITIPPDAVDETVMSITRVSRPTAEWKQPDISPAPIPECTEANGAFKIDLESGVTSLRKGAETSIRFDATKIYDIDPFSAYIIRAMEGTFTESTATFGLTRISVNSIRYPTRGSLNRFYFEYSGGIFGGDTAYNKYYLQSAWFFRLKWDTVLMIQGRWGRLQKRSGGMLPVYEKFFIGGIDTVRGFNYQEISPRDPYTLEKIGQAVKNELVSTRK